MPYYPILPMQRRNVSYEEVLTPWFLYEKDVESFHISAEEVTNISSLRFSPSRIFGNSACKQSSSLHSLKKGLNNSQHLDSRGSR